ncbi:ABC transporter permease [Pseudalkalibacillus sp. SCS-8]|uniref:ABC transporter permease n=1 Tax=Pseudalkalibacillus nanhaiensis TaxID=3115291 RepID=UPI0032DA8844
MKLLRNKKVRPYLHIAPAFLMIAGLLGYGVINGILESLQMDLSWSNEAYRFLFVESTFWTSLWYTFYITLISTLIALMIGFGITHFLFPYLVKDRWKAIIWVPMLFPHFAAGYLIVLLFSDSGWISGLSYKAGFISGLEEFPNLVNDSMGIGIILTYVWKEIPFVVLMLLPVYVQMDSRLKDVVRTLGGKKRNEFLTAQWPFLWPTIIEIAIILFAFIFAAFEVPYLLGVTFPQMTPVLAFEWFFEGNWEQRPLAFAAMVVVTLIIISFTILIYSTTQKYRHRLMRGS